VPPETLVRSRRFGAVGGLGLAGPCVARGCPASVRRHVTTPRRRALVDGPPLSGSTVARCRKVRPSVAASRARGLNTPGDRARTRLISRSHAGRARSHRIADTLEGRPAARRVLAVVRERVGPTRAPTDLYALAVGPDGDPHASAPRRRGPPAVRLALSRDRRLPETPTGAERVPGRAELLALGNSATCGGQTATGAVSFTH